VHPLQISTSILPSYVVLSSTLLKFVLNFFDKWETFRIWEEQTDVGRTEHRYYYDNYKLIRWLVKSYKDDFKPHYKSRDDKEFADKERAILKDVDNWLEFAISEQTDFETCMDNR